MQSTCTGEGYTVHTCSVCGDSYQDNTTPALGHSYTDTVTAPTCTGTGYTTHTCSVCGYSYQSDETAALGHSYTDTVTAPTCTETGYTTHTCSVCGDSYQSDETAALGHSYTATVVAPTCTERGYTRHVCSACGDSYQDTYVAALGHNYFLVKDPLWGQEIYRCIRCGHIKVEDEIPIIPVDPPVEVASYSLSSGSGEAERILDSTVVQEYAYVYNGSSLMQMVVQTTVDDGTPTTDTLYFSYDASGIPMSLVYNGTDYFYTVNLQGDVTSILNTSGTAVVEYTYDAWGNILTVTGSMADTLGAVNPLTYRGYVYDTETGLYYLQSRYYNPETGRFINADGYMATGQGLLGNNMFAYCLNNPVYYTDPSGNIAIFDDLLIVGGLALIAVISTSLLVPPPQTVEIISSGWETSSNTLHSSKSEPQKSTSNQAAAYSSQYTPPDLDDDDDYYNDDSNFGGRQKVGKPKGNTPGNNQAQNKQFKGATQGLSKDAQKEVHQEITGQGYGFREISNIATMTVTIIVINVVRFMNEVF